MYYPFGNLQAYRSLDVKFTYEGIKALLLSTDKKNRLTKETHTYTIKPGDISIYPVGAATVTHYDFISRKLGEYDYISYDRIKDQISIMYHTTVIARLYPDGTVAFNPLQDYRRNETKKRVNHIAQANGGAVYCKDFIWYISCQNITVTYGEAKYNCDSLNNGFYVLLLEKGNYPDLPLR